MVFDRTSVLGALPAEIAPTDLDRRDRHVGLGGLVCWRPRPPRAAVVHQRRLELGMHAAVVDLRDEDDVVADLELMERRALGPGESRPRASRAGRRGSAAK